MREARMLNRIYQYPEPPYCNEAGIKRISELQREVNRMTRTQRAYCIVTTVLSITNLAVVALAVWGSRHKRHSA